MLIRLNGDQVRVVGLWGFGAWPIWGWADTGMGRHRLGRHVEDTATQSRKFENKSNKSRILAIPILKLRPALNAVAFSTYTIKFQILKWSSSWCTLITFKVSVTGLDVSRRH